MRPGATQLTRMLCSEYVDAAPSASDATAPFAAATMSWLAVPSCDTAAEVSTMEPPADDLSPPSLCIIRVTCRGSNFPMDAGHLSHSQCNGHLHDFSIAAGHTDSGLQ